MNSNLVPEQRLDKNNRLAIKYVRPVTPASTSTHLLSAPQLPENIAEKTRKHIKQLASGLAEAYRDHVHSIADELSDQKLEYVADYMKKGGKVDLSDVYFLLGADYSEAEVHEYLTYVDAAPESDGDRTTILRCIGGVRWYYPDETLDDLADVSPEIQQTFRSLIRLTSVIHSWLEEDHLAAEQEYDENRNIINIIGYRELVDLIKEYPERGDEIAEYIKEHGLERGNRIRAMIESDGHRSLADGYL